MQDDEGLEDYFQNICMDVIGEFLVEIVFVYVGQRQGDYQQIKQVMCGCSNKFQYWWFFGWEVWYVLNEVQVEMDDYQNQDCNVDIGVDICGGNYFWCDCFIFVYCVVLGFYVFSEDQVEEDEQCYVLMQCVLWDGIV